MITLYTLLTRALTTRIFNRFSTEAMDLLFVLKGGVSQVQVLWLASLEFKRQTLSDTQRRSQFTGK